MDQDAVKNYIENVVETRISEIVGGVMARLDNLEANLQDLRNGASEALGDHGVRINKLIDSYGAMAQYIYDLETKKEPEAEVVRVKKKAVSNE